MEVLQWITKLCIECIDRKVSMMLLDKHTSRKRYVMPSLKVNNHMLTFSVDPEELGRQVSQKVFAKAINCLNSDDGEPCNECVICKGITQGTNSDVIEIDAASNNGVDEIRNIRDKKYAPSESKYKVYIIDEVHMLTTGRLTPCLKL